VEKETTISGIQRVSFEVIRRMIARHGAAAVRLSYWDRGKREYYAIPSDFIAEMEEFDPDILSAVFFGRGARPGNDAAPTLRRYRNKPLKYWFHYLRRSYHAARGNTAHFERHGSSLAEWQAFRSGQIEGPEPKHYDIKRTPVTRVAREGDPLIVMGATWAIEGIDGCFQNLADKHGLQIRQLIHDLIPIVTPIHVHGDFSAEFYRWLKASTGYCTSYFANSRNTARDLAAFMQEIGTERPIQTIPLAQAFTQITSEDRTYTMPADSFRGRLERTRGVDRDILNLAKVPYVLVVGTMETRKNIWRLAQVWDRLSREEGINVPKLVFAGKPGWYNDDFTKLMQATGNLGGWVQFAIRPNDTELTYLYENCLFTAMVSFYEGWGLPIGEGLSFGKTAVVADNSSMPEVGGDMVEYCDAHSLDSIHAAARKLIADPAHRMALEAKIRSTKLRSWEDVAQDFVDQLSK
jgi:glycosyltransferase involved in cell wall biosynthesis